MAVTYDQVRQFALALANLYEGRAYGGPSLRGSGKITTDQNTHIISPQGLLLLLLVPSTHKPCAY
jgi:hypothetical protein